MPKFYSSVEVEGEIFQGKGAKSKKQAEIDAAKTAYTVFKERESVTPPPLLSMSLILTLGTVRFFG